MTIFMGYCGGCSKYTPQDEIFILGKDGMAKKVYYKCCRCGSQNDELIIKRSRSNKIAQIILTGIWLIFWLAIFLFALEDFNIIAIFIAGFFMIIGSKGLYQSFTIEEREEVLDFNLEGKLKEVEKEQGKTGGS